MVPGAVVEMAARYARLAFWLHGGVADGSSYRPAAHQGHVRAPQAPVMVGQSLCRTASPPQ